MKINVNNLLSKIKKEVNESGSSSDGYKLVYPQDGELKVKLLYNVKSQVVMRLINKHTIGESKSVCLSQYGKTCPVCQVVSMIENAYPNTPDLWKMKNMKRAIMFAEYISSSYVVSRTEQFNPKRGEVILLMVPYMVYSELNQIMSEAGNDITKLISENTGRVVNITRFIDKGRVRYSSELDKVIDSHKTCESDEEFDKMLEDLPSLNDKIVPENFSTEIAQKAEQLAKELNTMYFSKSVSSAVNTPMSDEGSTQVVNGQKFKKVNGNWILESGSGTPTSIPIPTPTPTPTTSTTETDSSGSRPECFGKYDENNSKCMICSEEFDCQDQ